MKKEPELEKICEEILKSSPPQEKEEEKTKSKKDEAK